MKGDQENPSPDSKPKSTAARRGPASNQRPPSSFIPHRSSLLSRCRKTILGTLLVLAGLAMAIFTIMARNLSETWLARLGAILSLVFALLITLLVMPPLPRSADAEVARRGLPLGWTTGGCII